MMLAPKDVLELDAADPLKTKREEFLLDANTIYMDGNSLGPLTRAAKQRVSDVIDKQWGDDLIRSWNDHNWIDLPITVGDKLAELVGANKGQVVACDSTSVNLFKVLASALALNPKRRVILSQQDNFPTDLYMAQGMSELLGRERCALKSVTEDLLVDSLDESVAVLMLTQVNFRSGRLHNMRELTNLAHQKGALVIWDLAHSAGAMPIFLDECDVDFAVGCGYKYLNGGPGAPAFIYAAQKHHQAMTQPLSGWMGHRSPFAFEHDYRAGDAMLRFLTGTPNILSLAALDAALDVFSNVDLTAVRLKSIALSKLFIDCVDVAHGLQEFTLISPRDAADRGSQLAYRHPHAFAISQALIERSVVVDFRAPDIVRFGFTPLYMSFQQVWKAVQTLSDIIESKGYNTSAYSIRSKVT